MYHILEIYSFSTRVFKYESYIFHKSSIFYKNYWFRCAVGKRSPTSTKRSTSSDTRIAGTTTIHPLPPVSPSSFTMTKRKRSFSVPLELYDNDTKIVCYACPTPFLRRTHATHRARTPLPKSQTVQVHMLQSQVAVSYTRRSQDGVPCPFCYEKTVRNCGGRW